MTKIVSIRKAMPHLWGAMHMRAANSRSNLCIHRAAGFVLDNPGAELCFGTFRAATPEERARDPRTSDVPFIHAWAELNGKVYAPTLIERAGGALMPIERDEYYRANHARDIKRLSRRDVLRVSGEIGLSAHLRRNKPTRNGASVGAALMDAAGVKHADCGDGGIVPAEEEGADAMTKEKLTVRKRPCGSCPYRRDVPSGVWAEHEYRKLPDYDGSTGEQIAKRAIGAFHCHSTPEQLCAGWVGCHDMEENLALCFVGVAGIEVDPAVFDYESPIPLWSSGAEACAHGLAEIDAPSDKAVAVVEKLAPVVAARPKRFRKRS